MKNYKLIRWLPFLLFLFLLFFFSLLYFKDNKYKTSPPYGRSGVIQLTQSDLVRKRPIILTTGWLLSDKEVTEKPTYIGQYANLQRGDSAYSPHGYATYDLLLDYKGKDLETAIYFPQLFSKYSISIDGKLLSKGVGGAKVSFTLTEGTHKLMVQTSSSHGYYSGMYHPPMMSITKTIFQYVLLQCIFYSFAFFASLVLAIFTLCLWKTTADKVAFWFGLVCSFYALYISYYFVRLLCLPVVTIWYMIQSFALYGLCVCVLRLTIQSIEQIKEKEIFWIHRISFLFSIVLVMFSFFTAFFGNAISIHGILTDLYYIFTFCSLLYLAIIGHKQRKKEYLFIILSCTSFGMGLLFNLFFSNLFEPILFFWQFEWCGLFLIVLFGFMMVVRNKRILKENKDFQMHLEEMVEHRTKELNNLLQERKAFFADMAHDLKAPLVATNSFIQAIRSGNTFVDGELLYYLDLVEQKQHQMEHRVQSLSALNHYDAITQPKEKISVCALLKEIYDIHHMAAEVSSIHFIVIPPKTDGFVFAQPKKLHVLFENLIFNALSFTPINGSITIMAEIMDKKCLLSLSDTGTGIPQKDLPHIFQRFYVGENNKEKGTGLGLYIVKNIVTELDGKINLSSNPNLGTVFYIELPLIKNNT